MVGVKAGSTKLATQASISSLMKPCAGATCRGRGDIDCGFKPTPPTPVCSPAPRAPSNNGTGAAKSTQEGLPAHRPPTPPTPAAAAAHRAGHQDALDEDDKEQGGQGGHHRVLRLLRRRQWAAAIHLVAHRRNDGGPLLLLAAAARFPRPALQLQGGDGQLAGWKSGRVCLTPFMHPPFICITKQAQHTHTLAPAALPPAAHPLPPPLPAAAAAPAPAPLAAPLSAVMYKQGNEEQRGRRPGGAWLGLCGSSCAERALACCGLLCCSSVRRAARVVSNGLLQVPRLSARVWLCILGPAIDSGRL